MTLFTGTVIVIEERSLYHQLCRFINHVDLASILTPRFDKDPDTNPRCSEWTGMRHWSIHWQDKYCVYIRIIAVHQRHCVCVAGPKAERWASHAC